MPILFVIHGGFYVGVSGNDDIFGPDYLIEHDIIIVTINYRLGIFGFLSLNTPEFSGNMGLKDQQLALKWIYENIEQFYGDPKRITVIGHSAGRILFVGVDMFFFLFVVVVSVCESVLKFILFLL